MRLMAGKRRRTTTIPFGVVVALLVTLVAVAAVWRVGADRREARAPVAPSPSSVPSAGADAQGTVEPTPSPGRERAEEKEGGKDEEREREQRYAPTGRLVVVPGRGEIVGDGPLARYILEIEEGLPIDPEAFARKVERVLGDARGWGGSGRVSFQRVTGGQVAFRITLASREKTDELCSPLITNGIFSCFMRGRAVLNYWRWQTGSTVYPGDLDRYHVYMINHEVGHAIGHGHTTCPGAGQKAPVMMQQSKGLYGCVANAWPLDWERD